MSRCPPVLLQKAMRAPEGDHDGCAASSVSSTWRGAPPLASTTHSTLLPNRWYGLPISSVVNAICRLSGDQAGWTPKSVSRRADSPVTLATKMAPSVVAR